MRSARKRAALAKGGTFWAQSRFGAPSSRFQQYTPDEKKFNPRVQKERGVWLYTKEGMERFQRHCADNHVKSRGTVKIAGSSMYARALRTTRRINPGQAIVTMPITAGFNYLVVSRLMFDTPNAMPLQVNWMNWNERLAYLPGAAVHEFVTAAWMTRMHSLGEEPFHRYVAWLLQDTAGREGIASGLTKDRGDDNAQLDNVLTLISGDACEEGEEFLENFFRSYAALMHRTVPLELEALHHYLPGTNFFKAKAPELFVPTLFPLIDCVPQADNGLHNAMVDYIPRDKVDAATKDLEVSPGEFNHPAFAQGVCVLRAIDSIGPGDYVTIRSWPKTADHENERISNNILEATRMMSNDVATY